MEEGKKLEGRKLSGKKLSEKKLGGSVFSIGLFGWKENERERKQFSLVCLCGKVKGKKELMLQNDNFNLMLL